MRGLKSFHLAWVVPAVGLALWMSWSPARRVKAAPADSPRSAGFKITFGVRNPTHGRVWSGGVRNPAQIRSIRGWHLGTGDSIVPPDRWNITLELAGGVVSAKAVILDVLSPEQQPVTIFTRYGDFSFVPAGIPYGKTQPVPMTTGDVTIERVPVPQFSTGPQREDDDPALLRTRAGEYWLAWVGYRTIRRDGYRYTGGDEILVARGRDGVRWPEIVTLTPPGDHYRVALAEDARGSVWCVYSEQKELETGNFDLFARHFDGKRWSEEERLTTSPFPDIYHRLVADRTGNLYLTWMGYRTPAGGGVPQSDIFLRVYANGRWGAEINVSQSVENDWEPAIAVDRGGRAWIAWDSYRSADGSPANYDVLLRSYTGEGLGPIRTVSATALAEMRADVAVDPQDRVWVAWEEGGINWGKDTGYENPKHGIFLRPGGSRLYGPQNSQTALYRRPRVAVLEGDRWMQPKARLEDAYPASMQKNLYLSPRLGVDGSGQVWAFLRHQLVALGRNGGQMFDYYATTVTGAAGAQSWLAPILLPGSTGRQDTILAPAATPDGIAVAVAGDGRRFPVPLPVNNNVTTMAIDAARLHNAGVECEPFQPSAAGPYTATHPQEARQVEAVRNYRIAAGSTFKIVRGDVHRHTEISMDGAVDGSLADLYRYAIDAANLDYVAVTDHNYGAWLDTDEPGSRNTDNEYQWWRTQKSADLFYVPGRFVPLYGYERSVNFPVGHRNILHVRRGIFSFRVPKLFLSERPELIGKNMQGLWAYLRSTDGVALPHSTGTVMGTDWRLRDDELEPVAELYSGDWGGFEELGQARAATRDAIGGGFSGRAPFSQGMIWNALGAGYKLGAIASSDHWSTHIAYADLLVPDRVTTRADIIEAFRRRRTYAATDNIVLDFQAGSVLQGAEMESGASPAFQIKVRGTEPILRVEIVKNNRIVYTHGPAGPELEFSYRDADFADTGVSPTAEIHDWAVPGTGIRPRPAGKRAYYYVRVTQRFSREQPGEPGEVAWSSPIFVTE